MICTAGGETGNNRNKQKLAKVSKCFGLRYSLLYSLLVTRVILAYDHLADRGQF